MEKLIKLLREYIRSKYEYGEYGVYINKQNKLILEKQNGFMGYGIDEEWYDDVEFGESIIISKKFGFIERLVKNDKIDFKKLHSEEWYYKLVIMCDFNTDLRYDVLLMILSIQDNPIEYLCSILKE